MDWEQTRAEGGSHCGDRRGFLPLYLETGIPIPLLPIKQAKLDSVTTPFHNCPLEECISCLKLRFLLARDTPLSSSSSLTVPWVIRHSKKSRHKHQKSSQKMVGPEYAAPLLCNSRKVPSHFCASGTSLTRKY